MLEMWHNMARAATQGDCSAGLGRSRLGLLSTATRSDQLPRALASRSYTSWLQLQPRCVSHMPSVDTVEERVFSSWARR